MAAPPAHVNETYENIHNWLSRHYKNRISSKLNNVIFDFIDEPIPQNLVLSDVSEWQDVKSKKNQQIMDGKTESWDLRDLLKSEDNRVVIVGNSGTGKSIFAAETSSKLVDKFKTLQDYVPIFIDVENDDVPLSEIIASELSIMEMEEKPITTCMNSLFPDANLKILLIIDGIYKYSSKDIPTQVKFLDNLHNRYPNMKEIITTVPISDIFPLLEADKIIKLCPFTEGDVTNYLVKFGRKYPKKPIDFDDLIKKYNFTSEEICHPFYCFLLASQYYNDDLYALPDNFEPLVRKTWILYHYNRAKGERPLLRQIAAIKKIKNKIKPEEIQEILNPDSNVSDYDSKKIISLSNQFLMNGLLAEYLLAEFYLESLADGKINHLNIGLPSEDTILFLNGLTTLLEKNIRERSGILSETDTIWKLFHERESLASNQQLGSITRTFMNSIAKSIENDNLMFVDIDTSEDSPDPSELVQEEIEFYRDEDYKKYFIHRWISLFILQKLPYIKNKIQYDKEERQHIAQLIRFTSEFVPNYLKDFSGLDLSETNLSKADFSHAILNGTKFIGSDLTHAIFSSSSIYPDNLPSDDENSNIGPDFKSAHLFHTDLENAILPNSNFSDAFIWQSDFAGADLHGSTLNNAKLHYVRINDMTDLSKIKFEELGFTETPIRNALGIEEQEEKINKLETKVKNLKETIDKYTNLCSELSNHHRVRYVSLVMRQTLEIINPVRNDYYSQILTGKDKTVIAHYAWLSLEQLESIRETEFGDIRSFVVEYDKIKMVVVLISDSLLLLFTTDVLADQPSIIRWIIENRDRIENNQNIVNLLDSEEITNTIKINKITGQKSFKSLHIKPSGRISDGDFNFKCKELYDKNSDLVDFVGIFGKINCEAIGHYPKESQHLDILSEDLVKDIWRRWRYRHKFKRKIGSAKYAITSYQNRTLIASLISKTDLLIVIAKKSHKDNIEEIHKILDDVLSMKMI